MPFDKNYLARYTRPLHIVHDNGPEFLGHDFHCSLNYAGIKTKRISPNPTTVSAVIEASHKTIGQVTRTLDTSPAFQFKRARRT
jgi:hypothetical protein